MTKLLLAGRYELGRLLDRGGTAEVRKGRDRILGRKVEIVLLPARPSQRSSATDWLGPAALRSSAISSARLLHANILEVYDTGDDLIDGRKMVYVVMEYGAGRTLRDIIEDEGRLEVGRAMQIMAEVLSALAYGHRAGLLHLGVEPRNVVITDAGHVKLTNPGISRWLYYSDAEAAQYGSPDVYQGLSIDARSDIYSAGCVLYHMLTGRPPFVSESAIFTAYSHVREGATPPSSLVSAVPRKIDGIVLKALAKSPPSRFGSADQMRAAITEGSIAEPIAQSPLALERISELDRAQRRGRPSAVRRTRPVAGRPATPSTIVLKRPIVIASEEFDRRAEHIGDEVRLIQQCKDILNGRRNDYSTAFVTSIRLC